MAFTFLNIIIPKITLTTLPYFLVGILKDMFLMIMDSKSPELQESRDVSGYEQHRPSPSLVPVPIHFTNVESMKEHLPVSRYGDIVVPEYSESCDNHCAVCLTIMEGCDEVRRMVNCRHVFHKECIDAWIDKCKTTCPICRSGLMPGQEEKSKCGRDPWRRERMIYLFGEDYMMDAY